MVIQSRRGRGLSLARRPGRAAPRPLIKLSALLLAVLLLAYLSLRFFDATLRPLVEGVGVAKAKAIANTSVMRAVEEELSENGVTYADLVSVETSESGEVRALVCDIVRINQLKSRVSQRVQDNLAVDVVRVPIPIGNLFSGDLLSGRGPVINLRLIPYGSVLVNISNEFSSAGINQTLHRILLNITTGVSIMMPVSSVTATVDTTICVAETVIVGRVPEYYTNISDMPSDVEENILNFLNPIPSE
ncbi:MAG TPA: sporulation protein YunB [Terriglobales bacterium]|nr:sporulation protein YunB [Terriglobales bacterium]